MNLYDLSFDLRINVHRCDLYFMVQLFGHISWMLFDVWTVLFGCMIQYYVIFDLRVDVGHCDFALHIEDNLMYEHHTLDYESVWHNIWPQNNVGFCNL